MEDREMEENLEDLKALVQAVAQKDSQGARTIARSHVKRFNKHMKKYARMGVK
jgi:DNA-binding FadR family transcriptional regulator